MQQPEILINPLGYGATANDPPETTPVGTNKLSIRDLFPPITSIPIEAGGIPPDRADMNGIIKFIGERLHFYQNGGQYEYSEDLNYSPDNLVFYTNKLYKCIQSNGSQTSAGIKHPDNVLYWVSYEDLITLAETAAKNYADTKDAVTLGQAKSYADQQDAITLQTAKDYTDSKSTAIIGSIIYVSQTTAPNGYLACDGSEISREDFANLYQVIGDTFGAGDGETTFNIPDLIDKFIEGSLTSGTEIEAGIPNLTTVNSSGSDTGVGLQSSSCSGFCRNQDYGVFWTGNESPYSHIADTAVRTGRLHLDASRASAVYSNDITTVQPPALTFLPCIKY